MSPYLLQKLLALLVNNAVCARTGSRSVLVVGQRGNCMILRLRAPMEPLNRLDDVVTDARKPTATSNKRRETKIDGRMDAPEVAGSAGKMRSVAS